jgi:hypothetical protein
MSILALTSNTLIGTAAAGNIEYSSPIFTGTPIGTQRGIVPTQQYYRLNSAVVGGNVTTAQSIFGVGVTLSASTVYEFEMNLVFNKTAGTTSHTFGFGFAGTASLNNILYLSNGVAILSSTSGGGIGTTSYGSFATTASNSTTNMQTVGAAVSWAVILKGTVSINAGGTFIPQYTLSAAPGGAYSTAIGSFIRIAPVSASGSNTSVGAWA